MSKDIKYIVCISNPWKLETPAFNQRNWIKLWKVERKKKINFSQNWQQRNKCLSSMQKTCIEDPRQKSDE